MDRRIGVQLGGGPPPGYEWNVLIFEVAFNEAMSFLSEDQYRHLALQFKELARESDPSHSEATDVRAIEDYYELRDKGGILGKINVRVFFGIDKPQRNLVVLGCVKKEAERQTPTGIRVKMRQRWRNYRLGN